MGRERAIAPTDVEARTVRKLQARIIPFLFLLYIVAFLDRINIGFAALTMNRELAITSQQFGMVAGIFFFGYFLFEIPSNLLLHKIGARIWIARILISWGIVAALTGLVRSVLQLYFGRFLLGVAEAGFFPGIILYLTYWFRQREQAQAVGLFMTALPVSSIIGAPLSGLILDHVRWLGVGSWRWLLILEGIPAIACGVLTYFVLPSRPEEAGILTAEEKTWITAELAREELQKRAVHQMSAAEALASPRVWHLASINFAMLLTSYSVSFWMPQAVKLLSSHYSNSAVGFLVMIPYLVGLVTMILVSRSSDRRRERRYHVAIPAVTAGFGLLLVGTTHSTFLALALFSCATFGIYSYLGPFWALPNEFLTGFSAASGIALINSIANLGGFVGPYAIGAISRITGSLYGGLALAGISAFLGATLVLLLPVRSVVIATTERQLR
jgi:ACS family tartrate transporter-like MFS transporter